MPIKRNWCLKKKKKKMSDMMDAERGSIYIYIYIYSNSERYCRIEATSFVDFFHKM
jgi:hypothetical protein